jgi:hypothetical protein
MTQSVFSASPGSVTLLNQNFTQLYYLRELISDPSYTAAVPRITIAASGFIGIGTAPTEQLHVYNSGADATLKVENGSSSTSLQSNGQNGYLNMLGTGSIFMRQGAGATTRLQIDASGHFNAGADNTQTMGAAAKRWSVVYAGTGTINTSDAREKTAVRDLNAAELRAARRLACEIGAYQFLNAVAEKGDAARLHIGLTVQCAMDIMESEGLDPLRYGFICHDEWPADDEAGTPAGDRYAFRPDELLLFIARGFEARLAALEAAAG